MRSKVLELNTRQLVLISVVFIVLYQSAMMWVWLAFAGWDWVLLRFSLSMADVVSFLGLGVALYGFYRVECELQINTRRVK